MPRAAAAAPAPARPGRRRRRLSRLSDDAAARLPPLLPRCECRPARARGAHTHTPAGWRALTHARTPPKAPPPPPPPLALGVGGGGERGGGGRGRRAGRRPITSASSRLLASKVFTPGKKKVKGKRRPGARRAREPREGGNRGARGGEAETKGKRGERPGKPRRGGWARRTPRRGRRGRPRTLPDAPRLPGSPAPRGPESPAGFRRPRAPRSARAGGRGDVRPPGPRQTHLCLFSWLRRGRAFVSPSLMARAAPRTGPCPVGRQPGIVRKKRRKEPLQAHPFCPRPLEGGGSGE